jgi:hypothetical protein
MCIEISLRESFIKIIPNITALYSQVKHNHISELLHDSIV